MAVSVCCTRWIVPAKFAKKQSNRKSHKRSKRKIPFPKQCRDCGDYHSNPEISGGAASHTSSLTAPGRPQIATPSRWPVFLLSRKRVLRDRQSCTRQSLPKRTASSFSSCPGVLLFSFLPPFCRDSKFALPESFSHRHQKTTACLPWYQIFRPA